MGVLRQGKYTMSNWDGRGKYPPREQGDRGRLMGKDSEEILYNIEYTSRGQSRIMIRKRGSS